VAVIRVGDWALASRILATGSVRVNRAINQAVLQEAQFFRAQVIAGIRDQSPGGQAFKPLSASTLAVRRFKKFNGTKALLNRGDLRNSIRVHRQGAGAAFVGVLRSARNRDGRPLANVAELNEWGSRPIVIQVTPKMRRLLAIMHRREGNSSTTKGGMASTGVGIIVVQIPARPFIRPVADKLYSNRGEVRDRFLSRVAWNLRGDFGGPGAQGRGASVLGAFTEGGGTNLTRGRRSRGGGGILGFISRLFRGPGGPARDPNTGRFMRR
jgi:hypothetical protein